jgi:hypothetical protein
LGGVSKGNSQIIKKPVGCTWPWHFLGHESEGKDVSIYCPQALPWRLRLVFWGGGFPLPQVGVVEGGPGRFGTSGVRMQGANGGEVFICRLSQKWYFFYAANIKRLQFAQKYSVKCRKVDKIQIDVWPRYRRSVMCKIIKLYTGCAKMLPA